MSEHREKQDNGVEPPLKKQRIASVNGIVSHQIKIKDGNVNVNVDPLGLINNMNRIENMNNSNNVNNLGDIINNANANTNSNVTGYGDGKWTLFSTTAAEEVARIQNERKTDEIRFANFFQRFWNFDNQLGNTLTYYKDFLDKQEKRLIKDYGSDWRDKYANSDIDSQSESEYGSYVSSDNDNDNDDEGNYDDGDDIGGNIFQLNQIARISGINTINMNSNLNHQNRNQYNGVNDAITTNRTKNRNYSQQGQIF